MEGLLVTAFVFSVVGVLALIRIEKLIKILKKKKLRKKTLGVTYSNNLL